MEQAKALSTGLDKLYSKYHALLPKRQGILLRPNANVYYSNPVYAQKGPKGKVNTEMFIS